VEHRPGGGPDQPTQDDQAPNVWARRFRTPPRSRSAVLTNGCRRARSMSCTKIAEEPSLAQRRRRSAGVSTVETAARAGVRDRSSMGAALMDRECAAPASARVSDPNGGKSRLRHAVMFSGCAKPNDASRNDLLAIRVGRNGVPRLSFAPATCWGECLGFSPGRIERAWPDGRVGGVRHLPPRKVRAPWANCQVTPGRGSRIACCCDGQCHRKRAADVVEQSITGKGEKVG